MSLGSENAEHDTTSPGPSAPGTVENATFTLRRDTGQSIEDLAIDGDGGRR
jgi:hypothetical protein